MDATNEHKKDHQVNAKDKRTIPAPQQLGKGNFLALYWQRPLSDLMKGGEPLPGIQGRFLPDDPQDLEQSLGSYLSGGDEALPDFDAFKKELQSGDKKKAKRIMKEFKNLCPSPKELFERNPHLLNWVPWEVFIAYGDVLESQNTDNMQQHVGGKMTDVATGADYLPEAKQIFPRGYPKKRTDVVLERQNKDPKTQGILEAVSNSIDAIDASLEREELGQFGLGVKQIFAWLEKGKGEVSSITRSVNGEISALRARRGYDDQIYIKFSPPTSEEKEQFAEGETWTIIRVSEIDLSAKQQHDIERRVKERFPYVPETTISVNDEKINGCSDIKVIGRGNTVTPKGAIDITVDSDQIVIRDTGSGMNKQLFFKMFLPGHGKGYNPLSPTEARHIAQSQSEVLLIEDEHPRIVFSRNREADFSIEIPKDRLNTSPKTICIELGRILKVSEGREGFEIDQNFSEAIAILTQKVMDDDNLGDGEKTAFLNSVVLGIDQLSGVGDKNQEDKTASIVRKAKKGIREAALPYLRQLKKDDAVLLPNSSIYRKIMSEAQFVDPYLLEGLTDISTLLEEEGFDRLRGKDGIATKGGWKVLTASLKPGEKAGGSFARTKSKEALQKLRENLTEELPVIIDKDQRIVVLDQAVWTAMNEETDPVRRAYMQEAIQAMLNEKVFTSYEAEDPRAIFVHDREVAEHASAGAESLSRPERKAFQSSDAALPWTRGDSFLRITSNGTLETYDLKTGTLASTRSIPEMEGKSPVLLNATEKGTWVLCEPGEMFFLDTEGNLQEQFKTPDVVSTSGGGTIDKYRASISDNGGVFYTDTKNMKLFHPSNRGSIPVEVLPTIETSNALPHYTEDGILLEKDGKVIKLHFDKDDSITSSEENALNYEDRTYPNVKFLDYKDKTYIVAGTTQAYSKDRQTYITLFEINEKEGALQIEHLLDFSQEVEEFTHFSVFADPDSDRIGVQGGRDVYFLRESGGKFELEEGYKFNSRYTIESKKNIQYALNALKNLFGDDVDTSYAEAILALQERLANFTLHPIDIAALKEKGKRMPENSMSTEEEVGYHRRSYQYESASRTDSADIRAELNGELNREFNAPPDRSGLSPEAIASIKARSGGEEPPSETSPLLNPDAQQAPAPSIDELFLSTNPNLSQIQEFVALMHPGLTETERADKENELLMAVANDELLDEGLPEVPPTPARRKKNLPPLKDERTQKFIDLLGDPKMQKTFHSLWNELRSDSNSDQLQRLKMRFVRNAPLLLNRDEDEFAHDNLQLFFYTDNPQTFFDQSEAHRQKLSGTLKEIDDIAQKENFLKATEILTRGKDTENLTLFYDQLDKLWSKERFRDDFLRTISQHSNRLSQAVSAPEDLEITDPLRSYLLFLNNKAELIRTKEALTTEDNYVDLLPPDTSLELLAHLRRTEGLFSMSEVTDRIDRSGGAAALTRDVNLFHDQDEIRKAIHAQATEAGIEKRELLQNSFDAIRKKGRGDGTVNVDFYLRNGGEEFVEEVKDDGVGIDDLMAFLVPSITSKEGTGEQGFFGTGFYKNLEDVDSIEVDSVIESGDQNEARRVIIDVLRDGEGSVRGGVIRKVQAKPQSSLTETGTSIRLVRKTEDHLPELEAMVAKNTYITMGGLATIPELSDIDIDLAFTDEEGRPHPAEVPIDDQSSYDIDGIGKIIFAKSPNMPPLVSSAGLRMSLLYGSSSEYMRDIPESLQKLFSDEKVSIVLPKNLPLVKDRSRLANEEEYLPSIQRTVATEAIKRTASLLLSDSAVSVKGSIPEDILSNSIYYQILTSEEGKEAYVIAQKISSGAILNDEEVAYMQSEGAIDPLILVLIGIEREDEEGKKDSLLRRYQYIQEKSGNAVVSELVGRSMDIDVEQTARSPQLIREEARLVATAQAAARSGEMLSQLGRDIDEGRKPEQVKTLTETDLPPEEKELLTRYFSGIGFENVYFVPPEQLVLGGSFSGDKMYLNANLLRQDPRTRWETINHESSHLLEKRANGIESGAIEDEGGEKSYFTHQQEGSFAQYYKSIARLMQANLTS